MFHHLIKYTYVSSSYKIHVYFFIKLQDHTLLYSELFGMVDWVFNLHLPLYQLPFLGMFCMGLMAGSFLQIM